MVKVTDIIIGLTLFIILLAVAMIMLSGVIPGIEQVIKISKPG
jgi:hypothetical protein